MLIAQKPCIFCGKQYYGGDTVPAESVDPSRMKSLLKSGLLVQVADPAPAPADPAPAPEKPKEAPAKPKTVPQKKVST